MDTSNDTFSAARAHFLEGVTLLEAGRDAEAEHALQAALAAFVEEMKASGFVAEAMKRHGVQGAAVAPAA